MQAKIRPFVLCSSMLLCTLFFQFAWSEQKTLINGHDVHYIVIPTTFLQGEIAQRYQLPRGKNRALVNVSVLNADGEPVSVLVSGQSRNLLGQIQTLKFKEVRERNAIYYLAVLTHDDEETHRLDIEVAWPDGNRGAFELLQKLYWNE